jgi:transcriptional regulator with XRE-family HTH domain
MAQFPDNPIRRARERRGLTQADLALKLGLRLAMIEQIESGGSRANISHLDRLATLLGVSFSRLAQEYGDWWTAKQQHQKAEQARRKAAKRQGGKKA